MQAYQVTVPAAYIEFPYVKAKYPIGQALSAYFMAPPTFFAGSAEPQFGSDWIGIYPIGWTSLSQYVAKKMVKPEYFGGYTPLGHQYGEFEFEPEYLQRCAFTPEQQYHFVYVKNGQCVYGTSKPFTFVPSTEVYEGELYPTPATKQYEWMTSTLVAEKPLKTVIAEVYEMFDEHVHLESANRYLDQVGMLTHLKSYEQHIFSFVKHEQAIRDYVLAQKVDFFSKRVYELVKMNPERIAQAPEFYVRKYEQLMMDKIGMRVRHFSQLRQAIFKSELKLKELQTAEIQFYKQFSLKLKAKIAAFEAPTMDFAGLGGQSKLREHFKYLASSLLTEMAETKQSFYTAQQHIMHFIADVYATLESAWTAPEWTEIYTKFGIPTVSAYAVSKYYPYSYSCTPLVETGVHRQLESYHQTITSLKYKLAMLHAPGKLSFDAEFFSPIARAVGEFEAGILGEKATLFAQVPTYAPWFGERMHKIYKSKQFFETAFGEKAFDEAKLQFALWHLRELQTELYQFVHFFKYVYPTATKQVYGGRFVQHIETLQSVIGDKFTYLTSLYDRMPVEYVLTYGKFGAWKELLEAEKQAIALKSTLIVKEQFKQLYARLFDMERFATSKLHASYLEKLAILKDLFEFKSGGKLVNYPVYSTKTFGPFHYYQDMYYEFFKLIHETEAALWLTTPTTKFDYVFDRFLSSKPVKYFSSVFGTTGGYKFLGSMPSTYETFAYGPEAYKTNYTTGYTSLPTTMTAYTQGTPFYEEGFYPTKYKYPIGESTSMLSLGEFYSPLIKSEYVPSEAYGGSLYSGFESLSLDDIYTPCGVVKPTSFYGNATYGKKFDVGEFYDPIEIINGLEYEGYKSPFGDEGKYMPYYGF